MATLHLGEPDMGQGFDEIREGLSQDMHPDLLEK
jgi:hypothetical protein